MRAGLGCHQCANIMTHSHWLYERPICTGLGDRLGTIIALSALASLHNASYVVHMEWCTDNTKVLGQNPNHLHYIPHWTGYDYPIDTLYKTLRLPSNIRLFTSQQGINPSRLGIVWEEGRIPANHGTVQTSTLYCNALTLYPSDKQWSSRECADAYRKAGNQLQPIQAPDRYPRYVLVHFRGADNNTYTIGRDEITFCTRSVLQDLQAAGVYLKVISNNHSYSMPWLKGFPSMHITHSRLAWEDMSLALSAVAIVQHASEGWSAYTSVPAMARGIPLINTFAGRQHRFDLFAQYGPVPSEFYTCQQMQAFVRAAVSAT